MTTTPAETTETTIVDVGTPPQATFPAVTWKGENVPHRDLPHTGTDSLLLPSAGLLLAVGLLLTVVARKRHRKRYTVKRHPFPGDRPWYVFDRQTDAIAVDYRTRRAAKERARIKNANIPSLADSKGWKA